ncbi:saxitoxin and tetrodotoxin-binding protein 1-like [Cyclopterus lumpus]|uniref:saxitoxin and tetrodotoxin-binding protein 1-like n=1 Tax=Cyclopterus lumpus TaxID=8103 RepID=UPI0014875209|nr:saxitoxin and tetrodotoxin-binding protein 1-like [Cyclopterus lumpus]
MSSVNRAVLLLLVAAIGTKAAPGAEHCHGLKKLPTSDLHKIVGDWVLVWSVTDHPEGWDVLPNISSSHVEFRLHRDNRTVLFKERNLHLDKSCSKYIMNFTVTEAGNHMLDIIAATVEMAGLVSDLNQSIQIDFYESCSECLMVIYSSPSGRYLLNYKREGHHHDVEEMKSHHDTHKQLAECLRIPHDRHFSYDGAADFCHRKSSPEADNAATAEPVLS